MIETSARLLRLLSLFQGRRYWSGADLAEKLQVTTRTLRRDVDKLRSLGYPIHSAAGAEGGYQLGAGSDMPPLLLDDEEVVAVALGLHAAATGSVAGIQEASVRALAKIGQMLPNRLSRRVAALQSSVVTANRDRKEIDARTLSSIATACRDCETLRFGYRDHSGKETMRSTEPCRLIYTGYQWYLVAWDQERTDWRTFRVDRIAPPQRSGVRFTARKPPADDLAAYVSRGNWNVHSCRARVRLMASAMSLDGRVPYWIGSIEANDDRTCFLHASAASFANIALHLVMLGIEFEASEPEELIEELARLSRRITASCRQQRAAG